MASLLVVNGTLDALVLRALQRTPMHSFEITSWLEERSSDSFEVEDSVASQALYRIERERIEAEWGVTALYEDGDGDPHRSAEIRVIERA
jgi:hypothetical protein